MTAAHLTSGESFQRFHPQTFGIELEFIVQYDPARYVPSNLASHGENYRNVYEHMTHVLHSAGYPVNTPQIPFDESYGTTFPVLGSPFDTPARWTIAYDPSIKAKPKKSHIVEADIDLRREDPIQTQTLSESAVSGDGSNNDRRSHIRPIRSFKPRYAGIELKSPILPVSQESFEIIREVVMLLKRKFSLHCNLSTGFHVHVGYGQHGIPLRTLQNLAQVVTIFQPQIDSLHPPSRLDNHWCRRPLDNLEDESFDRHLRNALPVIPPRPRRYNFQPEAERRSFERGNYGSQNCVSESSSPIIDTNGVYGNQFASFSEARTTRTASQECTPSRLLTRRNQHLSMKTKAFALVQILEDVANVEHLMALMHPDEERYHAYNFKSLDKHRTVEFRQHVGTLNADRIIAWAEFVTGLIRFCNRVSAEAAFRLLSKFGPARLSLKQIKCKGTTDAGQEDDDDEDSTRTAQPLLPARSFSFLDLCCVIRKPHLVDFYRGKLFRHT
ncbi:hypothetical protein L228DRAFT_65688 [Xylona heveae TC161]|uniref:Amidoligase enzyme n=1 Tax=Xylona heveae (strain CBS 132557 / TC161) TaxID=1328760 RepID=A0A165IRC8_XYLHT|nr:hypothetical protein L228DRAFT_65688 [Xylona heveae TC161]KZF25273.1 hypothetical protein L228DRAFT_65688 [Xylona heveae TC161]